MRRFALHSHKINSVEKTIFKGRLQRWNKDKGFGFINPENEKRDIFIHISALKNMSRHPVVGDVIYYQIDFDKSGRKRAVNAKIEGVASVAPKTQGKLAKPHKKNSWVVQLLVLMVLIAIGVISYKKFIEETNLSDIGNPLTIFSTRTQSADNTLQETDSAGQSGLQIQGEGVVTEILSDDLEGPKHQRFILMLSDGQTLLVAHNIDLAPRINELKIGDIVRFYGEYKWNSKGGVVHWTHDDPSAQHTGGWLKYGGKTYR